MMKKHRGVVAIETAIGLPVLILILLTWIEFCLLLYSLSLTEHAFARAVLEAKKIDMSQQGASANYVQRTTNNLIQDGGTLWNDSTVTGSVDVNVHYFRDFNALSQCTGAFASVEECPSVSQTHNNMALAIYSLTYTYTPLVSVWIPPLPIRREMITVQEYERCAFSYSSGGGCE